MLCRLGQALNRRFEVAALHAQLLHRGGHRLRQARRGLLALLRHGLRGLQIRLTRGLSVGLQLCQVARRFQLRQLGAPLRQHRVQLFRRAAKAPRQAYPLAHALVQLGQLLGVGVGAPQIAVQAVGGIARLGHAGFQHLDQGGEFGFDAALLVQRVLCLRQRGQGAAFAIVAFQRGAGRLRGVDQRLRMRQAGVALVQLVPLAIGRGQLVEFADLPQQALALLRQAVLGCAGGLQRGVGLAPGLPGGGHRARIGAGIGIQQLAHGGGARQALPGVLAVNVDQPLAQLAQLRQRGAGAVDPGAAAAGTVDGAAQQQGAGFGVEAMLSQPGACRLGQVELGADLAARLAFAHPQRIAAPAQHQLQRVDQDRLAGARLAGQGREAATQRQIERRDDDEIAQG